MTSLDIREKQVLARLEDDDLIWHHRVLLRRSAGTTWAVFTPTLEIQLLDVRVPDSIRALGRNAAVPAACLDNCFWLEPLPAGDLRAARTGAKERVDITTGSNDVAFGIWISAEPSQSKRLAEGGRY